MAEKMIGGFSFKWLVAMVVLALVIGRATAVIQCTNAVAQLLPCEGYLLSGDPVPSAVCCGAVQALNKVASASRSDKKALCECFKKVAKSLPVNLLKAKQLPKLCHVNVGVAIDPNVDCNRI